MSLRGPEDESANGYEESCARDRSEIRLSIRSSRNEVKRRMRKADKKYVHGEMNRNTNDSAALKVIRNCIPAKEKSRLVYSRDTRELA